MKTLTELLASQLFKSYTDKIKTLETLNSVWAVAMDEWSQHCQIANYEQGILVLSVKNAAWATRLRFALPEIKKTLLSYPEFNDLEKIKYKILPSDASEDEA